MSKHKKNKFKSIRFYRETILRGAITCAAVLAIYLLGSLFFSNHFYIRSKVNGVGASFLGAEKTFEKIVSNADKYTISFKNADGDVVNEVSASDLGVDVNYDVSQVQDILDKQIGTAAHIVASSHEIKNDDKNPPCYQAKQQYIKKLKAGSDHFVNTATHNKVGDIPQPIVFKISETGKKLLALTSVAGASSIANPAPRAGQ